MAGPLPVSVTVSPPQQAILAGLLRQPSCPQAVAFRARLVLAAAAGERNEPLARRFRCSPSTIRTWRARWAAAEAQLAAAEADVNALQQAVAAVLADAPRSGAPDTFTAEQIVQIINLACTPPPEADRPVAAWTPRDLADEAVKQGSVPSISPRSVGRLLKAGRAQAPSAALLAHRQDQG